MDLNADKQAFVDAVLAPLPPDETARGILEESVHVAGGLMRDGGDAEAREAATRMQASAPGYRRRRLLRLVLGVAMMLGIAWFTLFSPAARHSLEKIVETSSAAQAIPRFMREVVARDHEDRATRRNQLNAERIAPEHRLTAMGDLSQEESDLRWKAVWDRYPEDPAHFKFYADAYRQAKSQWPDDFVATGERLDPGNGWFRWLTVIVRGGDVIEPAKRPTRTSRSSPPTPGTPASIKSEAEVQEILADWDRALTMPRWHSYRGGFAMRSEGLIPPEDYVDHLRSFSFAANCPNGDSVFWNRFRTFNESFIIVLAEHYVARGDRASLEALAARFVKTLERLAEASPDLKLLVIRSPASKVSMSLAGAFRKLGDATREAQFTAFSDRLDPKRLRPPAVTTSDALTEGRGTGWASYISRGTRFTPVAEEELRGGRLAEYAEVERILMHEMVLLMGIVVLCLWLAGYRERRGPRQVCSRLCGLLRPVDRAWIVGLGIVLPASVYLLCMRLPWSEMRAFGLDRGNLLPVIAVSCGLLLAWILCTAEATHWRLSRRAAIAGFGWHGLKPGRWIAVLVLMAMPASVTAYRAFVEWSLEDKWLKAFFGSLAALPLLWILWMCIAFFTGTMHRRMQRLILVRAMLPYLILATLLAALAIPALYQEEKYWTRRIAYEAVNMSNPFFNGESGDLVRWTHEQLVAALAELKKAGP